VLWNLLSRLWIGRTCSGRRRRDVKGFVLGTIVYNAAYGTNNFMRMWGGWNGLRIVSNGESLATTDVAWQLVIVITSMKRIYLGLPHYFLGELDSTCSHVSFKGHASVRTPHLYGIVSTSQNLFEEVLYIKKSKSVVALPYISFYISFILKYLRCQHLFMHKEIHQHRFMRADNQAL
jgi:hypothetical protein